MNDELISERVNGKKEQRWRRRRNKSRSGSGSDSGGRSGKVIKNRLPLTGSDSDKRSIELIMPRSG